MVLTKAYVVLRELLGRSVYLIGNYERRKCNIVEYLYYFYKILTYLSNNDKKNGYHKDSHLNNRKIVLIFNEFFYNFSIAGFDHNIV